MRLQPSAQTPQTEEGLQQTLRLLADARRDGDAAAEGAALLELAHLVKWVRSDNSQPPFERAHTLALEALEIFRRIEDRHGQISSLLLAVPLASRVAHAEMLDEADRLAQELGDELEIARTLLARASELAQRDGQGAKILSLQALEIYRKLNHTGGVASCLFSLSIAPGDSKENRANAIEAARLFREVGRRSEAARAMSIAVMNAEEPGELAALEPEILLAVADAQAAGDSDSEGRFYGNLAQVAAARGDTAAAEQYLRWEADLQDCDGMTPLERWQENMAMTKMIITMAKRSGNREMERSFQDVLRRIKKEKP